MARNSEGEVIGWIQKSRNFTIDPFTVECLAALEGVRLAAERGWSLVVIEGDCKGIIEALTSQSLTWLSCGAIVEEIKLLCSNFQDISFQHAFRDANTLQKNGFLVTNYFVTGH